MLLNVVLFTFDSMRVIRIIKSVSDIPLNNGFVPKWLTFHCTAGPKKQSTQEIFNYWKNHNKWTNVGYHFMISEYGTIEQCQEVWISTNGVKGYNTRNIHICYKGGQNETDTRTEAQIKSQFILLDFFKEKYPNIIALGHRDFSTDSNGNGILERWEWIKYCPAYDFRSDVMNRGQNSLIVPSKIVYKLNNPLIKNETVKAIQKALGINADGMFGANTDKAVKNFQAKHKLVADGIVGINTAKLLGVNI